ncbi:TonB-dependent receptor plug domain-containing protein [Prevotella sp. E15-22]|uniref:TonB-dependent receptor plug domain-containing protein n=1 Tax=Prevotella sp. E15-22 TaxID=2937774 RepID=UPI00206F719F|nr:TonB-dependent receptor plug domain-containing protein [Prevotella sp. E15-22]UPS44449.1 TonB-dependent receptor plug domain-containing protein [Prevotella sp. E15-22]
MIFRLTAAVAAVAPLPGMTQEASDIAREKDLQEVTITSRSVQKRMDEVQIGVEKVEIATLAKVPSLFGEKDIIKSLQLLPGVKSESEGSGGYQVRGGTAAQNLILLDGATVYNAGHLMGLFSTFNDDALMSGALYKGMVPAQFGGGSSSVFDISTRSGDMYDYHYGGTIGLLSAKVMAEGPIQEGKSSFLVSGRRSYLDLFLKATDEYKNNTLHFYDANVRLNFHLTQKDVLALSFFHGFDNMGLEDLMFMKWGNTTATANWLHTFSDQYYANTKLIYSDFSSHIGMDVMSMDYTMKGFIRHATLNHQHTWTIDGHHRMNYGLEGSYLQVQSAEWDIIELHEREKRNALTGALWIGDDWTISDALELQAGARLHLFSVLGGAPYYEIDADGNITNTTNPSSSHIVKTYADIEPRLSAKISLGAQHNLKIGYSRTSQDVHAINNGASGMPFSRYLMSSNIVKPEQANQVSLGWTGITRNGAYDFSAETYYKTIDNVYDFRDGKFFFSEIEVERIILGGKGRAYGLELCAHKNDGPLTGWISYTLAWSENKIEGINGGRWYTASNDRRHDLSIVGMYQLSPCWDVAATWHYNTGQALSAPTAKYDMFGNTFYSYSERNSYRAPACHRLDLSANYTRKHGKATHIWSFGVYNAYNRYNPYVIRFSNDDKKASGTKVEQTSLFGIVPSVSFTLKY